MKNLLFISLFSLVSSVAMACVEEAQFSSVVKEIKKINYNECRITLALNLSAGQNYNPSYMCPLDIEEVYENGFISSQCNYKAGDEISGYLVKNGNTIYKD